MKTFLSSSPLYHLWFTPTAMATISPTTWLHPHLVNHHSDVAIWRMVAALLTENHRHFVHCNGRHCTTTGKDLATWYRTPVKFLWTGYDPDTGYRIRFYSQPITGIGSFPT